MKYNFKIDEDGNILGHDNPGYFTDKTPGVQIEPDPNYQADDENWKVLEDWGFYYMVHKYTGLTPAVELHQTLTAAMTATAQGSVETKQVQNVLTQALNAQAQMQIGMTQIMNQMATQTQKGGL